MKKTIKGFTFEGTINKKEVGLYIPELKMFLDCGIDCNYNFARIVLITGRDIKRLFHLYWSFGEECILYVPKGSEKIFQEFLDSIHSLNNSRETKLLINIIGVEDGVKIEYKNLIIQVVGIDQDNIGYLFYEKRKKVKEEYKNLSKDKMKEMKDHLTMDILYPLFGYFGNREIKQEYKDHIIINQNIFNIH